MTPKKRNVSSIINKQSSKMSFEYKNILSRGIDTHGECLKMFITTVNIEYLNYEKINFKHRKSFK